MQSTTTSTQSIRIVINIPESPLPSTPSPVISWEKYLVYSIWRTIAIPLFLSVHENIEIYFRIGVFVDQIHPLMSATHFHFPYIAHERSYCLKLGKDRVFYCQDIAMNKFSVRFSIFDAGFISSKSPFLDSYVEN